MIFQFTHHVIIVINFSRKTMVYIPAKLVCQMLEEVDRHIPYETGGVIAGELIGNSQWIITNITMPGPKAIHKRFSFKPDYEHDENEIARIYRDTNCTSVYLGDWHSHPNSSSYISEKDKNVLEIIAKSKEARMPHPLMLIIGTSPLELGCWTYLKSRLGRKEFVRVLVNIAKI